MAIAVPPSPTDWAPLKIVPPLMRPKPRSEPPETWAPPPVPLALTVSLPPRRTIVEPATPPDRTTSLPPLDTGVPETTAPDATATVRPLVTE